MIGAGLAPEWRPGRLGLVLAAFALALGVAAHALDELNGRPLRTTIPRVLLAALAAVTLAGACAIGIAAAVVWTLWLLLFVAGGAFLVCAYNLEWLGGRFHSDAWFALAWGAFPLLTAYFAAAEELRGEAVLAAVFAALLSLAQRKLSTAARAIRRGGVPLDDPERRALLAAPEAALRALALAVIALAAALAVLRA